VFCNQIERTAHSKKRRCSRSVLRRPTCSRSRSSPRRWAGAAGRSFDVRPRLARARGDHEWSTQALTGSACVQQCRYEYDLARTDLARRHAWGAS